MLPAVTIIILNWKQLQLTLDCLDSVSKLNYPEECLKIIVVDNGSQDGSVAGLREAYPGITILENTENLGYAEGNNVGIRYAMASDTDYLLILNNDIIVDQDLLLGLVVASESDSKVGMAGPLILCKEPDSTVFAAGSFINWKTGTIVHRGMFTPLGATRLPHDIEKVDFLVGCCTLVRCEVVRKIGLMDPDYYLNYEDVDWCVKATKAGYDVEFIPSAKMWHHVSGTLGLASPANTYYMSRNALLFFWRNGKALWKLISVGLIMLRIVWTTTAWTLKREYHSDVFRRKRYANILALRDFITGRFGKMGEDVARLCLVN